MNELNLAVAVISLLIIITGLFYLNLQKSVFTEPLLAMAAGIFLGPFFLNLLDIKNWGDQFVIMEHACRFTMAMALMTTALRLPANYPFKSKGTQLPLILLGMTLMSLFAGLTVYLLFDLPFLISMTIGAIIAPTDPVVAATLVSGRIAESSLPQRIRDTISGESGANDGIGFPFVILPILLFKEPGPAFSKWFFQIVLWENIGGILIAVLLGYWARKLIQRSSRKKMTTSKAFLSYSLALGFFVLTFLSLIHCNGIIGVFAAGLALNYGLDREEDLKEEKIQEAMERLFMIPIFVFFGLFIPWEDIVDLGWKALIFPLLILLLRRLPAIFTISPLLKDLKTKGDLWFIGWFGPIGVAAMFYAMYAHSQLHRSELWVLTSLIIFSSTLVHGITSYPLVKYFKRRSLFDRPDGKK